MILGIDQGTTGTTAVLFDRSLNVAASGYAKIERKTPSPGYVEIVPKTLLDSVTSAVNSVFNNTAHTPAEVEAVGLANQGETSICWDKTGEPLHNAIVWQDRRTAARCEQLAEDDEFAAYVKETTGLRIDSYFSATKLEWLLSKVESEGPIYCGTTDTWLLWRLLTNDPYVTDHATASRTMLFDIENLEWDERLRQKFGIDAVELPEPVPMDKIVGQTDPDVLSGVNAPVGGCIVDQQSSLYGQGCVSRGDAKCTYGTGTFLLMNIGSDPVVDTNGVLGTVGWTLDGETTYALDGGIYTTGAFVDWLVDDLKLVDSPPQTEQIARQVDGSNGVYAIPALTGLAAPYWDAHTQGAIFGLDASTKRSHVVRAALEGIAHRVRDVVDAMVNTSGVSLSELQVDGGLTNNEFLLQYQADVLRTQISISSITESTALGAAALAAQAAGIDDKIGTPESTAKTVMPSDNSKSVQVTYKQWREALNMARQLGTPDVPD